MNKTAISLVLGICATASQAQTILTAEAYKWYPDSIVQGEYTAKANGPYEIVSTYSARPHYFMPVEKKWKLRNDISAYPKLTAPDPLSVAVYNMALDEMVNAVEPDTTLRTGKEWAGVWTRDVSYSIILSMAALQPEASMISLLRKVDSEGRIIQDTGSGGAWPISSDREVWILAAWEIYKVTGDISWLRKVYPVAVKSMQTDFKTLYSPAGLVKGETSFIDWREQSYPAWMQTADIAQSEAMGTNAVHAAALEVLAKMSDILGKKKEAAQYRRQSAELAENIDRYFWMEDKGYHGMYRYGRESMTLNPRAETLGEAIAVLYGVAPEEKARKAVASMPVTPYGPPVFFPQISDRPNYHNNALWPFVASYWALANAHAGNEAGTLDAIGSVIRPAALFATNKENLNLDNGDIFTELNSSNMLWSLSGNLALTQRILFGIGFEPEGLRISPFVPQPLGGTRKLENFPYRGARLNITVEGFGDTPESITLNGKKLNPAAIIPAKMLAKGGDIKVVMDNKPIGFSTVGRTANKKAPITPLARLETDPADGTRMLVWNPVEYVGEYILLADGKEVGRTHSTTWKDLPCGELQVVAVDSEGIPGFASEPVSTRPVKVFAPHSVATHAVSPEIPAEYRPAGAISGYLGEGFAETDKTMGDVSFAVDVPADGIYFLKVRYANGNGPVNTENRAAIRSLMLDGEDVATIVMPQRGRANWDDWGFSNVVPVSLKAGKHSIALRFNPEDENMNIATNHALVDLLYLSAPSCVTKK